jgi:hypothetical protein
MSNYNRTLSDGSLNRVRAIYVAYSFFEWMTQKRPNYKVKIITPWSYNLANQNKEMIESLFTREVKRIRQETWELHEYIEVSEDELETVTSLIRESTSSISFDLFPFVDTSFKINISDYFYDLALTVSFNVHPWWVSKIDTIDIKSISDDPTKFVTNRFERIELHSQNLENELDKFESYDVRLQQHMSKKIRDAMGIGKYSS